MIQLRTIMNVADNSGAKRVGLIKVLGGSRRRYAQLGDIVVCSVKVAEPKGGRIFGPIPREIKERGFSTIASLAQEIV